MPPKDAVFTQEQVEQLITARVATALKAEKTKYTELEGKYTELTAAHEGLKEAAGKVEGLEQQLAAKDGEISGLQRSTALTKSGLPEGVHAHVGILFEAHKATNPDATFDGWMGKEAKENPLLKGLFEQATKAAAADGGAGDAAAQAAAAAAAAQAAGTSPGNAGDASAALVTPDGKTKMTGPQLNTYFESAAFKSLSPEDQGKKLDEMEAVQSAAPATP